jgi:hypothetical protein
LGPTATIVLPNAATAVSRCVNGIFQLVTLPPDQVTQIVVQFQSAQTQAAEVVKVEALDGGLLAASVSATPPVQTTNNIPLPKGRVDTGTISADGTFAFVFKAGHSPGLYQIRISRPHQVQSVLGLQFWVADTQHPANNPPAMQPATAAPAPTYPPQPKI